MSSEPDYVTILPTQHTRKYLVAIMTYHARDEEFIQKKVSQNAVSLSAAHAIADMWAAALGIEKRV